MISLTEEKQLGFQFLPVSFTRNELTAMVGGGMGVGLSIPSLLNLTGLQVYKSCDSLRGSVCVFLPGLSLFSPSVFSLQTLHNAEGGNDLK